MNAPTRKRGVDDPEAAFGEPGAVLGHAGLSEEEKVKILLDWKHELLELQEAEAENMPNLRGTADVASRLKAVTDALIKLGHRSS